MVAARTVKKCLLSSSNGGDGSSESVRTCEASYCFVTVHGSTRKVQGCGPLSWITWVNRAITSSLCHSQIQTCIKFRKYVESRVLIIHYLAQKQQVSKFELTTNAGGSIITRQKDEKATTKQTLCERQTGLDCAGCWSTANLGTRK